MIQFLFLILLMGLMLFSGMRIGVYRLKHPNKTKAEVAIDLYHGKVILFKEIWKRF